MSWTTELANAEAAEQTYRATRKGSLPDFARWDTRGAQVMQDWIQARSAVSSAFRKDNVSAWVNVAMRAVTAMGTSWTVPQGLVPQAPSSFYYPTWSLTPAPYASFIGGNGLDGLFGGLLSAWADGIWLASGHSDPAFAFPPQETWSSLFAHTLQAAGLT